MIASEARRTLVSLIEKVNEDHTPVEIVGQRGTAILVAKEDWDSMAEAVRLLCYPSDARQVLDGMARARRRT